MKPLQQVRRELDRRRTRSLMAALTGLAAAQVADVSAQLLASQPAVVAFAALSLGGYSVFAYSLLRIFRVTRQMRHTPGLAAELDDERMKLLRAQAFATAFWILLLAQGILLLLSDWLAIPARMLAQVSIAIGCAAALGGFFWLDR